MWAAPFSMRNLWIKTGNRQKKLSCRLEKKWLSILCSDNDVSVASSSQNSWQIVSTHSDRFVRPPLINLFSSFASSGSAGFLMHAVEELLEFLRNGFKKLLVGFSKESCTGLCEGKAISARVVLDVVRNLSIPPLSDFFFK